MKIERYLYSESSNTNLWFENDTLHERYIIYPRGIPSKIKAVYVNNKYVKKEMLDIQDDKIICKYYVSRCLKPNITIYPNIRIYYYIDIYNEEEE